MISTDKPKDFRPVFSIVSCYVKRGDMFVLLKRSEKKRLQPGMWGVPAGKVDEDEDLLEAVVREVFEETGIAVGRDAVQYRETLNVRYDGPDKYDFEYAVFEFHAPEDALVQISDEHTEFRWVTPHEALEMNLIYDLDACIRRHF